MIRDYIDELLKNLGFDFDAILLKDLRDCYQNLSLRYRSYTEKAQNSGFKNNLEHWVYLLVRLPATHAVLKEIFKNHFEATVDKSKELTCLDIGSGPGIVGYTLAEFLNLKNLHMIDQDSHLIDVSQKVLHKILSPCAVKGQLADISKVDFVSADIVCMSYVLTELSVDAALSIYKKALNVTNWRNVIVMPGTPKAFSLLMELRDIAIASGFEIVAPCPHHKKCPMFDLQKNQWCHFQQFVPRTPMHQFIKEGDVSYELEPYCYLIVERSTSNEFYKKNIGCGGRIIQTPTHKKGHIYLDVCNQDGSIYKKCITKKQKDYYRRAKKLKWGGEYFKELKIQSD